MSLEATVAALLVAVAVLLWPAGDRTVRLAQVLDRGPDPEGVAPPPGAPPALGRVLREDPVDLVRRWWHGRGGRDRADALEVAEGILAAIAPALEAGLTPVAATVVAAEAFGDADGPAAALLADLHSVAARGEPLAPVWADHAERTGAGPLQFVAAAWTLAEETGAPLAEAARRAVGGLAAARDRDRRVSIAVAGPRATVTVLTVLPLAGPIFGLACGIGPVELYANPVAGACLVAGIGLMLLGRTWCRRMIEAATAVPTPPDRSR